MRHVLTLNAGSSSLKFGLFEPADKDPVELCSGLVDRIGSDEGNIKLKGPEGGVLAQSGPEPIAGHAEAVRRALAMIERVIPQSRITAVGHRVVHGGVDFNAPQVVTDAVLQDLSDLAPFAPLHQPHNITGIRAAHLAFPDAVQVACFDTAFHRSHPFEFDAFALPMRYFKKGVRRYGFHGLSYEYIVGHMARVFPDLLKGRVIVAHLGNGASMCGLSAGRSIVSTMGFSALDGLPMGTRTGALDPGVMLYLMQQEGLSAEEISDLVYKQSGLLGLSGLSNDMRILEENGGPEADRAIAYFTTRIRHELGALAADLGGVDAVVFTGGIGENSQRVRAEVCKGSGWLGLDFDPEANAANATEINTSQSRVKALIISTNEELVIARAAFAASMETLTE